MIYVVLGMHKSGTTLVAEILHKSGIQMINPNDGDPDYDTGNKYERISTALLNKKLLDCWDTYSLDILPGELSAKALADFQENVQQIVKEARSGTDNWGFKDPRTCLTYQQWQKHLPKHRLIVVYRHPAQVMKHYEKRNLRRKKLTILYKALKAWSIYNGQILKIVNNTTAEHIVINFEQFMSGQKEIERLAKFIGHPLNDARDLNKYKMKNNKHLFLDPVDRLQTFFHGIEPYKQTFDKLLALQDN